MYGYTKLHFRLGGDPLEVSQEPVLGIASINLSRELRRDTGADPPSQRRQQWIEQLRQQLNCYCLPELHLTNLVQPLPNQQTEAGAGRAEWLHPAATEHYQDR